MALRSTACRLASSAKVNTVNLYHQMDPTPTRNWRHHFAAKLQPDEEGAKAAIHKQNVYTFGEDYGKVTELNFPYPLFYSVMLFIPMVFMAVYIDMSGHDSNHPQHSWKPKNADGSTQFPLHPEQPNNCFEYEIKERE